jgi:hypothetical protein
MTQKKEYNNYHERFPRQDYLKESVAYLIARLDISRFLSLVLPEVMQE